MARQKPRGRKGARKRQIRIRASVDLLRSGEITGQKLRQFYREQFSAFAAQRIEIFDDLRRWAATSSVAFQVSKWQRLVRTKYLTTPLSAAGSSANPTGGRFNFGRIEPSQFPPFPALYLAEDKVTARLEVFGEEVRGRGKLNRLERALAEPDSVAEFSVSGRINELLDLTDRRYLVGFLNLTRNFEHPEHLTETAKRLGIDSIAANRLDVLYESIMRSDWRVLPNFYGIPSNSQILGQIAYLAGVEGILYLSSRSDRKCLAVFPENFANSDSYLRLDDPVPEDAPQIITELNKSTWTQLI